MSALITLPLLPSPRTSTWNTPIERPCAERSDSITSGSLPSTSSEKTPTAPSVPLPPMRENELASPENRTDPCAEHAATRMLSAKAETLLVEGGGRLRRPIVRAHLEEGPTLAQRLPVRADEEASEDSAILKSRRRTGDTCEALAGAMCEHLLHKHGHLPRHTGGLRELLAGARHGTHGH
eukprot:scaffold28236_cov59-Phaeocystis_antarctica.AAC.10